MTVGELRERLRLCNGDMPVVLNNDVVGDFVPVDARIVEDPYSNTYRLVICLEED